MTSKATTVKRTAVLAWAVAALSVAPSIQPNVAVADASSQSAPRAITRNVDCSQRGTLKLTMKKGTRRAALGFTLSGALPLQQYYFEGSFLVSDPGGGSLQPSAYDGAATTDLRGRADFSGIVVRRNKVVRYSFSATDNRNNCAMRGRLRT